MDILPNVTETRYSSTPELSRMKLKVECDPIYIVGSKLPTLLDDHKKQWM